MKRKKWATWNMPGSQAQGAASDWITGVNQSESFFALPTILFYFRYAGNEQPYWYYMTNGDGREGTV